MENPPTRMMERRRFLRLATTVPALAALAGLVSPLLRLLKPNVDKFRIYAPTAHDTPQGEAIVAATLSEVARPWDFKYFVFTQKYPQYTPQGFKAAVVPGVVVRLPRKIRLYDPATGRGPLAWARDIGKTPRVTDSDLVVFSRICPHLGCIFNYVPDYREITAGYGGYVPPPERRHALMGCPCHLSIYDPADPQVPGRVLSGPAPRPPRTFLFEVRGGDIVITDVEPGGIA
ncbi:MAG: Rieske 2Fe-2S domain-containing protein [Armatimonadota bacterium]|nr:Rieske 2Fe-2S domain-containing protein [Armatimonadota bacterium]MDR7402413.1 Rieske 2Fe-2S domain-containing protein [Armatimonadota bacterium]MDR7404247.1 Rieske 2Fe-2S domain-containing protein [Armatimonadota bacterium]MDR7437566.1 Rieske 2Fe-2S domain-containing protein [Armatimonadota bacterium]MDR7472160.1 Rieske 2Fe-2S domain-containing protein [Armatimonadota bacterium]